MIALRMAAALCSASAVLLAGAFGGGALSLDGAGRSGAKAADRGTPSGASHPGDGGEIPVADSLEVSGQPMRLAVLSTPDPPSRVIAFYADAFRARGLVPVVSPGDAFAHVSVFDPADGLQRFVSALPQPDGRTLVMTGTTDPRRPALLHGIGGGATLPVPPGHRGYLSFRSVDGEVRAESAQFVTPLPLAGIAAFYREALGREGYAQTPAPGDALLTFARAGGTFSVAMQKLAQDGGSGVFVTRIEGAAR